MPGIAIKVSEAHSDCIEEITVDARTLARSANWVGCRMCVCVCVCVCVRVLANRTMASIDVTEAEGAWSHAGGSGAPMPDPKSTASSCI